jgi:hypothetical protein
MMKYTWKLCRVKAREYLLDGAMLLDEVEGTDWADAWTNVSCFLHNHSVEVPRMLSQ